MAIVNHPTRPTFEQRRQIILLRRQGLAVPDIALRLGVTHQVVSSYFHRQGWNPQEPRAVFTRAAAPLSEEQIVAWAQEYQATHGHLPRATTTEIDGTNGETWLGIDLALRRGLRGLSGNLSLARLLKAKLGSAEQPAGGRLNLEQILRWADYHQEQTGVWPRWNSGTVLDAPTETWTKIDRALFLGTRGLPGGMTLLRLLRENGRTVIRRDAWKPEEDALLGTAPDLTIAERVGRTEKAVAARRQQLGIPRHRHP
jgi:hypothetical protein